MRLLLSTILTTWTIALFAIHPSVIPFEAEEVILIDTERLQELSFLQERFLGNTNTQSSRALQLQERLNAELHSQITAIQLVSYVRRPNRETAIFFSGKFDNAILGTWAEANGFKRRTIGSHLTFERPYDSKERSGNGANIHPYVGLNIAILPDQTLVVSSIHEAEKVLQRLDRNEPSQPIPTEAVECFSTTENGGLFKYAQLPTAKPDRDNSQCLFYYVSAGVSAGDLHVRAGVRFATKEKSDAIVKTAKSFQESLAETFSKRGANTDLTKAALGYAIECVNSVQLSWEKESLIIRLKYSAEKTEKALNYLKKS